MNTLESKGTSIKLDYSEGIFVRSSNGTDLPATVFWEGEDFSAKTDYANSNEFSFYKYRSDNVAIRFTPLRSGLLTTFSNLEMVQQFKIDLFDTYDFRCNCHGYSLMNGKYWLDDPTILLNDEYVIINEKDLKFDVEYVITFMDGNLYVHSGKILNGVVKHKRNVCKEEVETIKELEIRYPMRKIYWEKRGP